MTTESSTPPIWPCSSAVGVRANRRTGRARRGGLKTKLEEWGVGFGKLAQPIRVALGVAVSGTTVSPQIIDTLILLGRERTIARIKNCSTQRSC